MWNSDTEPTESEQTRERISVLITAGLKESRFVKASCNEVREKDVQVMSRQASPSLFFPGHAY